MDSTFFCGVSLSAAFLVGVTCGYVLRGRNRNKLKDFEIIADTLASIPIQGFDAQGRIFLWNRASETMYGHLRQAAYGKNIAELLLPEADRKIFLQVVSEIVKTNKPAGPRQWTVVARGGVKQMM